MPVDNHQPGKLDTTARLLYTLETVGRAYRDGGIHVSDALPFGQQCEVRAMLAELAKFADNAQAAESRGKAHGDGTQ